MKVKFCGIRRQKDIEYINSLPIKPDYVGFILAEGYRRTVSIDTAAELADGLDKNIKKVGVFVNQPADIIKSAAEKIPLDVCQLHGDETNEYVCGLRGIISCDIWKAVRVRNSQDIIAANLMETDALLLDSFSENTYGGTGKTADWDIIKNTPITKNFFIAGGINTDNISDVLKITNAFGVDISSGIETDGFKERLKMVDIMEKMHGLK